MKTMLRMALLLALATLPAGCLAAAVAAGAGGAIAYNERGAQSQVNGSVADVAADARAVLTAMGITPDGEDGGDGGENDVTVSGTRGEMRVRVEIERQSATTSEVMVTAREGTLDYDREMARDILSRIMARG
jgi:opacity protein-like surface antigen